MVVNTIQQRSRKDGFLYIGAEVSRMENGLRDVSVSQP